MRAPQQQYKLGLNDYLSCTGIGLFFKALPEKGLMEKGKKLQAARNLNNALLLYSLLLLMVLLFLNKLLSGDYKDHALLSHIKIH